MFVLTLFITILALASAYPNYQANIPNGDKVPNPCGPGTWAGVGHTHAKGMGQRNEFGEAFAAEGHVWTYALCQADSDRDGKKNGEELGDPHCHWTPTNNAHIQRATSHPGICEPVGSTGCAWQNFHCSQAL